ncbi:hypothetical protein COY17_03680 [Candidatus Saccharibacteria bacterium CG_4_10_14_0_2_um_filter_52_9]|nr:MAG: hypothetical protein COY17_03680 [Candidatus Saccharibacteria bacterium CG_4_10_14_0_2_um_filter_52_9]
MVAKMVSKLLYRTLLLQVYPTTKGYIVPKLKYPLLLALLRMVAHLTFLHLMPLALPRILVWGLPVT